MDLFQSPRATQASRYVPADFETYRGTSGGSSTAAPVDSPKGTAVPEVKQPVGLEGPASQPDAPEGSEEQSPAASSLDWLNALLAKAREEPPEDGA